MTNHVSSMLLGMANFIDKQDGKKILSVMFADIFSLQECGD